MTRPRFSSFRLLLPLLLAGLSGSSPAARQAPEASGPVNTTPAVTFRTEINYVEVDAAVYTRDGQFVNDLRREDFEVREDGQPQEVNTFSLVNIPIERPDQPLYSTRPIASDIVTNARPFDGRLYVIVLDDLHISAMHTAQVRKAGKEFIERYMGTNDLAAVVHTSGRNDASQEFTSNKQLLEASIDMFIGLKLRSQTL
jgi:VWFA-related protein